MTNENETATNATLEIQRIYVKDASFESPQTPHTFLEEWKPEVSLNLETKNSIVQDNVHEVILTVTANVTSNSKTIFVVEVQQAGLFAIQGFEPEQLNHVLGSFCPSTLFPYARETISSLVGRGGFPQLNLAPINFDALYNQHLQQQGANSDTGSHTIN